ncbi:MAG TPA: ATPase domain-containing protein [Anaerolineae bacterium]|nr:ATPase domain-containing protein [Anaerolineae bacterium]
MKKISSGIPGLDELLNGGLYERSSTVIAGPPGTGKTTFGVQFIYNGAVRFNEPGIFITFEEFPEIIYRDAMNIGWDLKKYEAEDKIKVVFTSPAVLKSELEKENGLLDKIVAKTDAKRIVVDSVTLMEQVGFDQRELRQVLNSLINGMKRLGLTTILTSEIPLLFGHDNAFESSIGFIVDNILFLRYVEIESELETALTILKARGSQHAKDIRKYEITSNGINIEKKFAGHQGILTGFPSRMISGKTLLEEGLIRKKR